jgi:hypothetical protein
MSDSAISRISIVLFVDAMTRRRRRLGTPQEVTRVAADRGFLRRLAGKWFVKELANDARYSWHRLLGELCRRQLLHQI